MARRVADISATPFRKGVVLSGHSRTPSGSNSLSRGSMTGNSRKTSGKRSHVESSLESASSDQSNLADLAKGSHLYRMAHLDVKRKKMELAAEERALVLKQQMREKEYAHAERMVKYKLELTRLKAQNPAAVGFGQDDRPTDTYPPPSDNFSQDTTAFSVGDACGTSQAPAS